MDLGNIINLGHMNSGEPRSCAAPSPGVKPLPQWIQVLAAELLGCSYYGVSPRGGGSSRCVPAAAFAHCALCAWPHGWSAMP
eukprot:scaffold52151_cov19-Tisochrysis_lutea.AAC.4